MHTKKGENFVVDNTTYLMKQVNYKCIISGLYVLSVLEQLHCEHLNINDAFKRQITVKENPRSLSISKPVF